MRFDTTNARGWTVFNVRANSKVERVRWLDTDSKTLEVVEHPMRVERGELIAHELTFDAYDIDFQRKTISVAMSNKPSPKPHPAPHGVGRTQGQPPVSPPKGRD